MGRNSNIVEILVTTKEYSFVKVPNQDNSIIPHYVAFFSFNNAMQFIFQLASKWFPQL